MPSLRSRLFNTLLKNRHRLPLQAIPTRISRDTSIADLRRVIEQRARLLAHLLPDRLRWLASLLDDAGARTHGAAIEPERSAAI